MGAQREIMMNLVRTKLAGWGIQLARWSNPALRIEVNRRLEPRIDYRSLGLRDANRTGWYCGEQSELCEGFSIVSTDTVIDVGCGDGGNIQFCARYADQVIAVDTDPKRLAAAREKLQSGNARYTVMLGDAGALPIKTAVAHKIVCTEVLEHVDDPAQVLGELARVGRPGALYLLTVPDAASENAIKRVAPKGAFEKPNHIRIIGRDDFERMVETAGLTVVAHRYRGFYWAVWWTLSWRCGVTVMKGSHPALDHWARAWSAVLDMPNGQDCKDALDHAMPKSQTIIARKP